MAEEIKNLIEKIQQEGIQAAEEKSRQMQNEAKQQADEIIAKAKSEAEKISAAAKERITQMEEKERVLIAQAGRDLLLSLREEINAMLQRIVVSEIRQSLTTEALFGILSELIKGYGIKHSGDIVVLLKKEDAEALEKKFLHKLKEETGKGIILKTSEEITGGFSISFDSGKSCYDFSDKALAEYIGAYLKPKLSQILRGAVSDKK